MLQQLTVMFCWFGLLQQRLPPPPGCWSFVGSGLASFCCVPDVESTMRKSGPASDPCGFKHSHLRINTSAIWAMLSLLSCITHVLERLAIIKVDVSGQVFGQQAVRRTFTSGCVISSRNYQFKLATTAATWALQLSFSLQRNAVGLTMSWVNEMCNISACRYSIKY